MRTSFGCYYGVCRLRPWFVTLRGTLMLTNWSLSLCDVVVIPVQTEMFAVETLPIQLERIRLPASISILSSSRSTCYQICLIPV